MHELEVGSIEEGLKGILQDWPLAKDSLSGTSLSEGIEIKGDIGESGEKRVKVLSLAGPSIIITYLGGGPVRMVSGVLPAAVHIGRELETDALVQQAIQVKDERIQQFEDFVGGMWTDDQVDAAVKIAVEPYDRTLKSMWIVLVILLLEVLIAAALVLWRR